MTREESVAWTPAQAPDQTGRVAVVTGANAGIGIEIARNLAFLGATAVLACRDTGAAARARDRITASAPGTTVATVPLDLADLASVNACVTALAARYGQVDLLINNAGVMTAQRRETADGFEADFGTNFLGHFALTGGLVTAGALAATGRVVTVTSVTHRGREASIDFDDLQSKSGFDPRRAYARSKMAVTTFAFELQRRLEAAGTQMMSVAAHPGGVRTAILRDRHPLMRLVYHRHLAPLTGWFTQSPAAGALPVLRAATDPTITGASLIGPGGRGELVGPPVQVRASNRARDQTTGRRLWHVAQELTGVAFLDELR